MLDWQLRRLASLSRAKEQGKQGQEQGRHLLKCPLISSLLCHLCLVHSTSGAADDSSPALPPECPQKRWWPLPATDQAGADAITVCVWVHSTRVINQCTVNNMKRQRSVIEKLRTNDQAINVGQEWDFSTGQQAWTRTASTDQRFHLHSHILGKKTLHAFKTVNSWFNCQFYLNILTSHFGEALALFLNSFYISIAGNIISNQDKVVILFTN